jgi:hypothetical protein
MTDVPYLWLGTKEVDDTKTEKEKKRNDRKSRNEIKYDLERMNFFILTLFAYDAYDVGPMK